MEKPKKMKAFKIMLIVIAIIIVLLSSICIYISSKLSKINYESVQNSSNISYTEDLEADSQKASNQSNPYLTETDEVDKAVENTNAGAEAENAKADLVDDDIINILLVGVDNDNLPGINALGNADGQIIMSINPQKEQISLVSIMRDTYIQIPNSYSTKITLVYHDQGLETLIDTIEYNFDIDIDNYVMINYLGLMNVIDAIGGVELEVNELEIWGMSGKIKNLNTLTKEPLDTDMLYPSDAGVINLNGKQIAAYLRIRNTGDYDYGRTARARKVLIAIKDKIKDLNIFELNKLADVAAENITTDISSKQMLKLLANSVKYIKYDIYSGRIPVDGSNTGDGSYVYIDYDINREYLHNMINGEIQN